MKKILSPIALIIILLITSCRGPLAKPGDDAKNTGTKEELSTAMSHMQSARAEKEDITLKPAEGGITIGELLSNKDKYAGKVVRIKGKVTKINPAILGKNWIHLQDGTGAGDLFDLTVTATVIPDIKSIITVEGKIALDKDFGHGYTYEILMEDAKIIQ
jgi:hypothetical protein